MRARNVRQINLPANHFTRPCIPMKALTDSSPILYSLPNTECREGTDLDETDDGRLSTRLRWEREPNQVCGGTGPHKEVINNNNDNQSVAQTPLSLMGGLRPPALKLTPPASKASGGVSRGGLNPPCH